MTGKDLLALCKSALAAAGEPEAELYARVAERGCARFAVGALGQHMQLSEPQAVARVAVGKRLAEVETTRLDRDALVRAVRDAARAARVVPEEPAFAGFAGDEPMPAEEPPRFVRATASATPEERVERLAPVLDAVRAAGFVAAGMLETTGVAHALATTHGCARSHDASIAAFRVWALETAGAGGAAGYGGHVHRDVRDLRIGDQTERAIRICARSRDPVSLDAGSYDVVLEPEAVVELMEWLARAPSRAAWDSASPAMRST